MQTKTYAYQEALQESEKYFGNDLSARAFVDKYGLRNHDNELVEQIPKEMHHRIATELARVEANKFKKPLSYKTILDYLTDFAAIIPQGSPMYGIGNIYKYVSLSNCFVLESPYDSYGGICKTDQEIANICKRRGGIGWDISNLRPVNSPTNNAAVTTTGIESWMQRFSNTVREVGQSGRRGASMQSISVHHPEISKFVTIKEDNTKVTGSNISVRLTDEFLNALESKAEYQQRWPVDSKEPSIVNYASAKKTWDEIIHAAWSMAEPGLLFWDNIIRESPADCYENFKSISVNPCAELVLCANDSCRLLAINLFHAVEDAYTKEAGYNYAMLYHTAYMAQRMMDNIVDLEIEAVDKIIKKIKSDPEPLNVKRPELDLWIEIKKKAQNGRRTGTGITALGDTLAALGIKYGSPKSIEITGAIYKTIKQACYQCSVDMAEELGPFPEWDHELEKNNDFLLRIKDEFPSMYKAMKKHGRRNIALLTTAPTGTVSMMASMTVGDKTVHGTTSGIEPLFATGYTRRKKGNPGDKDFRSDFVDDNGDHWMHFEVNHPGIELWAGVEAERLLTNPKTKPKTHPYVCADEINWVNRVKLQAAAQQHVDHAISSTINLPNDVKEEEVAKIYLAAWKNNLKGITVYRDGCRTGVLLAQGQRDDKAIVKTNAPKRPKSLPCEIFHTNVKGKSYFVLVGIWKDGSPYEIFSGRNGVISAKDKHGHLVKLARPKCYRLEIEGEVVLQPITLSCSDDEEILTRMISTSLRHGVPVNFLLDQLTKVQGDMSSFAKGLARTLKKYIQDNTKSSNSCPECGQKLVYL